MNSLEGKYRHSLLSAEKQLKNFQTVQPTQWTPVSKSVYTAELNNIKTIKVVQDLNSNETNLDHVYASLVTVGKRSLWCPFFEDLQVTSQPDTETNIIHANISSTSLEDNSTNRGMDLVEQTIKRKHHIQHISTSLNDDNNYLLCIHIENRFDSARATVYYQWNKAFSTTLISTLLSKLIHLKPFPWVSQCDKAIQSLKSIYIGESEFELEYTFTERNSKNDVAMDILSNKGYHHHHQHKRWPSGSWDQQRQQQQQQSDQTLRKNNFLSSSSLIFSASPKLSATRVMSSYPDKGPAGILSFATNEINNEDSTDKSKEELRIEVDRIPKLNIKLIGNEAWSNKFAHLCVRCYKKPTLGYIVQILHPHNLMQYFEEEIGEEETMKLDDEEKEAIQVHIHLEDSPENHLLVNNNEWPVRSWNLSGNGEASSSTSEEENEEDEDIFVDGMENILDTTTTVNEVVPSPRFELPAPVIAPKETVTDQKPAPVDDAAASIASKPILHPLEGKSVKAPTAEAQSPKIPVTVVQPQKSKKVKDSAKLEVTPDDDIDREEEEQQLLEKMTIPENDPVALQKIYPQFSQYLNSSSSSQAAAEAVPTTVIQSPSKDNGYVTVKQLQIPDHPMGGFLSESTWKDCSIWDIKSVLESAGARKIWDNTFESTTFLHALTQTSSIWHTKIKGAWPVNPRDYVCFHGQYTSPHRIDLLSTSCIGDSFQYKPLPKETPGYIRATMDMMGWRLERIDSQTTSVKQLMITQFSTWVINYITSRFLVQSCSAVQFARDYFDAFGAPPSLESLHWASLVNLKHDHERKNWRCEYTRRTTDSSDKDKDRKAVIVVAADAATTAPPSTVSVIRLDKRRWASGSKNRYSIVIDPPPSRVTALEKACDPYGVWVSVEHDEEFIIPLRGKILVLIKPDQQVVGDGECHLNVNSVTTFIEKEAPLKLSAPTISDVKRASFSANFLKDEEATLPVVERGVPVKANLPVTEVEEEDQVLTALKQLPVTPRDRAQAALTFLRQTDEQFGWTVISDNNKSGLRVSKKPGLKTMKKPNTASESSEDASTSTTLVVPDPYMVYKATKVIENFSVEEVATVVTDIGSVRKTYDDTLEQIDLVQDIDPGTRVISQSVKAIFPFKNREVYATSCLVQETATSPSSPTQRTLYIESSIPEFPILDARKTRGHLYMSGWILEAVDPYTTTTNHPIPSTRVTYVSALDLGTAVPSYISNLVANNWAPKKIQSVESYLKANGPPPFLTQPPMALVFANNKLSSSQQGDGAIEFLTLNTNYDKKTHHYNANYRMKLDNNIAAKPAKPNTIEDVVPSASSSTASATSPIRRPSTHTLTSPDVNSRRGSLPVNALPKKRIVPVVAPTSTSSDIKEKLVTIPSRNIIFLQASFDLRAYTKGYEITAQLYDVTHKRKNMSNKLTLSISEPSLSNLMDGKKKHIKHAVLIKGEGISPPSTATYEFEFLLTPVREETLLNRPTRLTVSHVLGEDEEDKDKWNGVIMINGVESQIGTDVALKPIVEDDTESIVTHDDLKPGSPLPSSSDIGETGSTHGGAQSDTSSGSEDNDSFEEPLNALQYMGGGVVATAIGNVSAGVNNLGARMFRSTSFLLPLNNTPKEIQHEKPNQPSSHPHSSDDDEEYSNRRIVRFSKDERRKMSSTTLHEVRLLRRSRDTMRKGMFLLLICLATAVVFALLMLQPMLERYYASFTASSTIDHLNDSIEKGVIQRLVQIPWFGGWDIQIIAVRRNI